MKKIIVLTASAIFMFLVGFITYYQYSYSLADSMDNFENKITHFLSNSKLNGSIAKISVEYQCSIDDRKFVLFYINKELAYAELKRGLNSKYKIISVTKDIDMLRTEIIKTNKGKYLFVAGKNENLQINYIRAKIGVDSYKVTIPKENNFIAYRPVPSWASLAEDPDTVRVMDTKDNDITDNVRLD